MNSNFVAPAGQGEPQKWKPCQTYGATQASSAAPRTILSHPRFHRLTLVYRWNSFQIVGVPCHNSAEVSTPAQGQVVGLMNTVFPRFSSQPQGSNCVHSPQKGSVASNQGAQSSCPCQSCADDCALKWWSWKQSGVQAENAAASSAEALAVPSLQSFCEFAMATLRQLKDTIWIRWAKIS